MQIYKLLIFFVKTDKQNIFLNKYLIFSVNIYIININNTIIKRGGLEMPEFTYEIVKHLGVISEGSGGWAKELNLISWNGKEPKYDIRDRGPEH